MKLDLFGRDSKGMAALEMAIALPILMFLLLAIVDYGNYFIKNQIVQRTVSTTSSTVQSKASDATYSLAANQGMGFVDYTISPNYVCAMSYTTSALANASLCQRGNWTTSAPTGLAAGSSYYVAIVAYVTHKSIAPFSLVGSALPAQIKVTSIVQVSPGTSASGQKVCVVSYTDDVPQITSINVPASWTNQHCKDYMETMKNNVGSTQGYNRHHFVYKLQCVFNDGTTSASITDSTDSIGASVRNYGSTDYNTKTTFIPSPNCGW